MKNINNFEKCLKILQETQLNEYISNPLIWFRNYINDNDNNNESKAAEIAQLLNYGYLLDEYYDEYEIDEDQRVDDAFDMSDSELIEYGQWCIDNDKISESDEMSEFPSWYFMSNATIVKNNWLIHVSNEIPSIIRDGFSYGIEDYTKLGLTTHYSDAYKKRNKDDTFYTFSYTPQDFERYWRRGAYGDEFLMFISSGVRVWHNSDEEYQTLFMASTAKDFVPIYERNGDFNVIHKKTGDTIYSNDNPNAVVEWVIKNIHKYGRAIVQRERN